MASVKTPKSFLSPSDSEEEGGVAEDDEGWEDAEADVEETTATCLFCAQELQSSNEVFQHCASVHDFDFAAVRKDLGQLSHHPLIALFLFFSFSSD